MRKAFIKTLTELAGEDERIVLLTGDLGFTVVEDFAFAHPDRFFNVGVAEANMIGIATGLAKQGFLPFCYSIATFAILRPYEQIRNGPILNEQPVRIVGVGGGFSYGSAGHTHHALEDIGVARMQPGLAIVNPADDNQTSLALRATYAQTGAIYYRIAKDSRSLPGGPDTWHPGLLWNSPGGTDALLVCNGGMASVTLEAQAMLSTRGISASVSIISGIRPEPVDSLVKELNDMRAVVSIEDHYITGGIGSLLAEILADRGIGMRLLRLGVVDPPDGISGSEEYMLSRAGLSASGISDRIQRELAPADA